MDTSIQNNKGNGRTSSGTGTGQGAGNGGDKGAQAELDMLYSLKSTIDSNGRFKYRLNDLSTGYAAGRGMDAVEARSEIIGKFEKQFGKDPLQYSNELFEQRRENSQSKSQSAGRGR